jgi:hypothetical protein
MWSSIFNHIQQCKWVWSKSNDVDQLWVPFNGEFFLDCHKTMEIYSMVEMISYHHKMAKIIFHHYPTMRKIFNCHQMLLIIFDHHKKMEITFNQHLWWWSFSIFNFHQQRGHLFLPSNKGYFLIAIQLDKCHFWSLLDSGDNFWLMSHKGDCLWSPSNGKNYIWLSSLGRSLPFYYKWCKKI